MAPVQRQAIIWTNTGLVCWRIDASPRLNDLTRLVSNGNQKKYLDLL